jgi:hypothetical protein
MKLYNLPDHYQIKFIDDKIYTVSTHYIFKMKRFPLKCLYMSSTSGIITTMITSTGFVSFVNFLKTSTIPELIEDKINLALMARKMIHTEAIKILKEKLDLAIQLQTKLINKNTYIVKIFEGNENKLVFDNINHFNNFYISPVDFDFTNEGNYGLIHFAPSPIIDYIVKNESYDINLKDKYCNTTSMNLIKYSKEQCIYNDNLNIQKNLKTIITSPNYDWYIKNNNGDTFLHCVVKSNYLVIHNLIFINLVKYLDSELFEIPNNNGETILSINNYLRKFSDYTILTKCNNIKDDVNKNLLTYKYHIMNYCTLDNFDHPELIYSLIKEFIIDFLKNDPTYAKCITNISKRYGVDEIQITNLKVKDLRFITSKNFDL